MFPRALVLVLFLAPSALAQTQTRFTMCQVTPVTVFEGVEDKRLIGCGAGFPDNVLWHLDRSDSATGSLDRIARANLTGRGVVAYMIDTGIMQAHTEFQRADGTNIIGAVNASTNGNCHFLAPCIQSISDYSTYGHGTATASVLGGRITGVAPDAKIVAVFYPGGGDLSWEEALLGILGHAYAPGSPPFQTAIVSMSTAPGFNDSPRFEALMRRMITGVNAAGDADSNGKKFLFLALGGNAGPPPFGHCTESSDVNLFPARIAHLVNGLIAVGGLTEENTQWDGGCRGPAIEVLAPATNMLVASPTGSDLYRGMVGQVSGTSYSTPYVAGMAARLLESDPTLTPVQLEARLKQSPSIVDGKPVPVMLVDAVKKQRAVRK